MKGTKTLFLLAGTIAMASHAKPESEWETWFAETAGQRVGASIIRISDDQRDSFNLGAVTVDGDHAPSADTPFEIGSITKAFTNLLLAELVAKGVVEYQTTIASIVPEVQFGNPEVGGITLEQLATHTSGLPRLPSNMRPANPADPYADYTPQLLLEELSSVRSGQSLAHQYAYSNLGVGLLGYVLGKADGSDYGSALEEHVLAPLGIKAELGCMEGSAIGHAGQSPVPYWHLDALAGAGGLCMSANELAKVFTQYLTDAKPLAHELQKDFEIVAGAGPYSVTRVWHVAGDGDNTVYWHNGGTGGFRSFAGFNPASKEALVILSNTDADVTEVGMEALLGDAGNRPSTDASATAGSFEEYTGHFLLNPGFSISVFERDGMLFGQATGQPPLTLGAAGEDRFNVMEVDASIEFTRNDDGEVSGLVLNQNGVAQPAPRVDEPVRPKTYDEIALPDTALDEYVGEYQLGPGFVFTIRHENGQITAQLTGQGPAPIYAHAKDEFFYRIVDAQLTFTRGADGEINGLILHQNGMDQPANKL